MIWNCFPKYSQNTTQHTHYNTTQQHNINTTQHTDYIIYNTTYTSIICTNEVPRVSQCPRHVLIALVKASKERSANFHKA